MARRRFFVEEIRRGAAELTGTDAEHLVRVLRVEPGERFEISDNRNVYLAEVETARKSHVEFRILEAIEPRPVRLQTTLAAALFKFDRFEWMLEKATELGVWTVQPVEATRTERGLAQASAKRSERWERIALEASQQSRRDRLPRIERTVRFPKALEMAADIRLLLDESPDALPILQCLPTVHTVPVHVAMLLGPEGGWTDEERAEALRTGWQACSLGHMVLRVETATVAALAIVGAWGTILHMS
ncbi:MAG: 16S rRNA (uracil(1498)-N(3))-methyltransferase [Acidobacteriaceae bacterium]|nr:16S rRNA (uracil(1498)-N(3))-methyltransferase [Acidobacteriaceae bacterium]